MTPCTLDALRAAVARVLVARGEAADALVCSAYTFGGSTTAHIDAVAREDFQQLLRDAEPVLRSDNKPHFVSPLKR